MTEVQPCKPFHDNSKATKTCHVGLFATKDYAIGEIILVESAPLIQLSSTILSSPSSKYEEEWIKEMMINDVSTTNESNQIAVHIPNRDSKVMAMAEIAFCFVIHLSKKFQKSLEWENDTIICNLHNLYHPSATEADLPTQEVEQSLIALSHRAVLYVQKKLVHFVSIENSKDDDEAASDSNDPRTLRRFVNDVLLSATAHPESDSSDEVSLTLHPIIQEIMLIWACNAFDGGMIYNTFSRINHSCNPNSVVVVDSENSNQNSSKQTLMAALSIAAGDEISISYLHGPFLYADRNTRQKLLLEDKYFTCTCSRCDASLPDIPSAIPCLQCYPRECSTASTTNLNSDTIDALLTRVLLPEDVQYDDDHDVHYAYPNFNVVASTSNVNGPEFGCSLSLTAKKKKKPPIDHQIRYYNKIYTTAQAIIDKVVSFLRHPRPNIVTNQDHPHSNQSNDTKAENKQDNDSEEKQVIYLEQLEQLLRMSSSILGTKHWTTNMLLLYQLNHVLATFHTCSILKITSQQQNTNEDDDDDTESTIAEAIDMLQRIEQFAVGITSLQIHMGHLLSDVIIGVARALVSLGDVKSQKYAAKWIDKILVHVNQFESPGKRAVVHALHIAWQRSDSTPGNETRSTAKRLKR